MTKVKPANEATAKDGASFLGMLIGYILLGYLFAREGLQLSDFEMWLGIFIVLFLQYGAFNWGTSSSK